ncbi:AAA domain-containing protein [Rhodocollybia butyracea]|uniref:AAA domain-containing protein n=1 Tax=Rhodocollybia butyracea TaxID=206335 RepID=A0A9P5PWR1_9AGAR|nr:AAA domain-containing protein [Rhodocollybia butyracea]
MESLKAIYIVGPSSTGKTTLCNALITRLGLTSDMCITEVARTVMREQGFTRADVHSLAMQQAIVNAQATRDRQARQKATEDVVPKLQSILLSDRSAVDAVVYAALSETTLQSGNTKALVSSPEFLEVLPFYRSLHSTFVLLRPIPEWMIDDGVRSLEDGERCYAMFVKVLKELDIPFVEVGEECRWLGERVAFVRRLVFA